MLWQRIKKNCPKAHLVRIESSTMNGIPDINGCFASKEFWMELKSDKVGYPKLSKWQISWINKRIEHGGRVLICNETLLEKKLKLYRPLSAFRSSFTETSFLVLVSRTLGRLPGCPLGAAGSPCSESSFSFNEARTTVRC